MATYNFSALADGQSVSFRPGVDVLRFDQSVISAADLRITALGSATRVQVVSGQYAGKDVLLLNTTPYQLYTGNVAFASGSRLLVGDNSVIQNDNGSSALSGTAGRDVFYGFGGDDSLSGGDGNDVFVMANGTAPNYGIDTIDGGNGTDTLDFSAARSPVMANLAAHSVTGGGADGGGGAFVAGVDVIIGGPFDDSLRGNGAQNRLEGRAGNDTLDSASGRDTLIGGPGNDTYIVYAGDVLRESSGIDTVIANNTSWTLASGFENLTLAGTGHFNATGNSAANVIVGNSGGNTLRGGAGNDLLIGGDEAFPEPWLDPIEPVDMLDGGPGNDTLRGGGGNDGFILTGAYGQDAIDGGPGEDMVFGGFQSAVTIDLAARTVTGGGSSTTARATLTSIEDARGGAFADRIFGDEAANLLIGGRGNDALNGRGGNDLLLGEEGADTLTGGAGADEFFFWGAPAAAGADRITDFVSGTDRFVLNVFGDFSGDFTPNDERFYAARGATSAHDATDRVVYDTGAGRLYYDPDGIGGASAVLLATLTGAAHVAATDFTAW
jgi:Ca2+-binding RTX toxin-like protein